MSQNMPAEVVAPKTQNPEQQARLKDGLLALYHFNEGRGAIVTDQSQVGQSLDLEITDVENATWLSCGGLRTHKDALVRSTMSATKIVDAVKNSGAITIEAWIARDHRDSRGSLPIVSCASGYRESNFILLEKSKYYEMRMRTTETKGTGSKDSLKTKCDKPEYDCESDCKDSKKDTRDRDYPKDSCPSNICKNALTHILYTLSADGVARFYLNGALCGETNTTGSISNWDASFPLVLAGYLDEKKKYSWEGDYFLLAFYDRALTSEEITQNFQVGLDQIHPKITANLVASPESGKVPLEVIFDASNSSACEGTIVEYTFDFGEGSATVTTTEPNTSHTYTTSGDYTASVIITDDRGNKASSSVQITASQPELTNRPPVAEDLETVTLEDNSIELTLIANDPDGDTLTYQIETLPEHGTLAIEGTPVTATPFLLPANKISFFPPMDFNGAVSFNYTAQDSHSSNSASSTVTITVNPVNDAPIVTLGEDFDIEGTALPFLSNLITNGSAEVFNAQGTITDWEGAAGSRFKSANTSSLPNVDAIDGSKVFSAENADLSSLVQTIDLSNLAEDIDAGRGRFLFSGFVRGIDEQNTDTAQVVIRLLDQAGSTLGDEIVASFDSLSSTWLPVSLNINAAPEARFAEIELIAKRTIAEQGNDVYFDALSFRQIQLSEVNLCGSVEDDGTPAGTPLQISWRQLSGPEGAYISSPADACTTIGLSVAGTYIFELTADDSELSNSDTIQIDYSYGGNNQPPTVEVGGAIEVILPENSVDLNATVTDDLLPLESLTLSWSRVSGPTPVEFDNAASISPNATFTRSGAYVLRLTVSDGEFTVFDELIVTVDCPEEPIPIDFAIAIDHSGSMGSGPGSKLEAARDAAERFIRNIDFFYDRAAVFALDSVQPAVALTNDIESLVQGIFSLTGSFNDPSNFGNAISYAQNHLDEAARANAERIIVVVADGQTNRANVITSANAAKAKGSRIITLAIGLDADVQLLEDAASKPSDAFFVTDVTDVETVFETIGQSICRFEENGNTSLEVFPGPNIDLLESNISYMATGYVEIIGAPAQAPRLLEWSQVAGPAPVIIDNSNTLTPTFNFDQAGTYTFSFRATMGEAISEKYLQIRTGYSCDTNAPRGLIGWWSLDYNSFDNFTSRQALEMNPSWREGVVGGALDSTDRFDALLVPERAGLDIGSSAEGWSIEFWINPDDRFSGNSPYASILEWSDDNGRGLRLVHHAYEELRIIEESSSASTLSYNTNNDYIPDLAWTHVALSYDRSVGQLSIYRNGSPWQTWDVGIRDFDTSGDLWIGGRPGTHGYFNGALDELSLYDRPLSQAEVLTLHAAAERGKCPLTANQAPSVYAGEDVGIAGIETSLTLSGEVTDDGLPVGSALSANWTVAFAPDGGTATFTDASNSNSEVSFSTEGIYTLRLSATDSLTESEDYVTIRVGQTCGVDAPDGLVAWFPLDNSSFDEVAGTSALELNPSWRVGKVGAALDSAKQSDLLLVPERAGLDIGSSAEGWSIEFWINPDDRLSGNSPYASILEWSGDSGRGLRLVHHAYAELRIIEGSSSAPTLSYNTNNDYIPDLAWTHVALSYDRSVGQLSIYKNGSPWQIWDVGIHDFDTSGDLWIGGRPGTQGYFNGALDELSLYDRPLSQAEVLTLHAAAERGKCPLTANQAPSVYAGKDVAIDGIETTLTLSGEVTDDALPVGNVMSANWSVAFAPDGGTATFTDASDPNSKVSFSAAGIYTLRLSATDSLAESEDYVTVRVGQTCGADAPDGLVAWFPLDNSSFDEVSGTIALELNPSWREGKVGAALDAENKSSALLIPERAGLDIGSSAEGWSIEFWINPDSTYSGINPYASILEWSGVSERGLRLVHHAHAELRIIEGSSSAPTLSYNTNNDCIPDLAWTHVALSYDRSVGQLSIYKNGSPWQTWDVGIRDFDTSGDFWIGGRPSTQGYFNGALDELSFYDRPLSQAEVFTLHAAAERGKCPLTANQAPSVYAGEDVAIDGTETTLILNGEVIDDGRPVGNVLSANWSVAFAPDGGTAIFTDASNSNSEVSFSTAGIYTLRLSATDNLAESEDYVTVRVGQTCSVDAPDGLVAWFPLDNNSFDEVGGVNALELNPSWRAGKVGAALDASGQSDALLVAERAGLDVGSSAEGWSIEFWINPDSTYSGFSPYASILEWSGKNARGLRLVHHAHAELRIIEGSSSAPTLNYTTSNDCIPGFAWTHVTLSYDRSVGQLSIYKNGSPWQTWDVGIRDFDTSGDLWIGGRPRTHGYFNGALDELSLYDRPLTSEEISNIYTTYEAGECYRVIAANLTPSLLLAIPQEVSIPHNGIDVSGIVTDDGLPAGNDLTVTWSVVSGPAATDWQQTSFINPSNGEMDNNILFTVPGTYVIAVEASDGELTTRQEREVVAIEQVNQAPDVDAGGDVEVALSNLSFNLAGIVSDDGLPLGNEVSVTWTLISGFSGVTFSDPNSLATTATLPTGGTYVLQLSASDGILTNTDTLTVRVTGAPIVEVTLPGEGGVYYPDETITFQANANVAGLPVDSVEFFVNNSSIGTASRLEGTLTHKLTVPVASLGISNATAEVYATATDGEGVSSVSEIRTFSVVDPVADAPAALIVSPEDNLEVTEPTPIIGTVASDILDGYQLEYRLGSANSWTLLASGNEPVEAAELGVFDPTLLRNGIYKVRLSVTDLLGRTVRDTVTYIVDTQMKVGHFSLAFEDLTVPLSGISIQLLRSYDSRGSLKGDFGSGWDLGMRSVQVHENGTLGNGWETEVTRVLPFVGIPMYNILPTQRHIVTVVLGDSQVEQFEAVVTSEDVALLAPTSVTVGFRPINGSVGSLSLVGSNYFNVQYDGNPQGVGVPAQIGLFDAVDPSRYTYTAADGTEMEIQEVLGLRKLTDLNDNTLTFDENGITHSNGQSIIFDRDGEGRITSITDPDGNTLVYGYKQGQSGLHTFTNRVGQTTEFIYADERYPDYLTDILNPGDVRAIRTEYDDEGRIDRQIDADGNPIEFEHDLDNFAERITDRLGNTTTYFYDKSGNVTRQVDPMGAQTLFEYYPGTDLVKYETDDLGNVTSRAYDAKENLLVEITGASTSEDPLTATTGFITRYTYNEFGSPLTIIDPNGNLTEFEYDSNGNLRYQHQKGVSEITGEPETLTTGFTYYPSGDIKTITDAEGNITRYKYEYGNIDAQYPSAVKLQTVTVEDDAENPLRVTESLYDRQENLLVERFNRTLAPALSSTLSVIEGSGVEGDESTEQVTTRYFYDEENRLVATVLPDGQVNETRYNIIGKEAASIRWKSEADYQVDDLKLARVTSMEYDNRGNLIRTVYPDGSFTRSGYNKEGRMIWSANQLGQITAMAYDEVGRQTHTIMASEGDPDADSASDKEPDPDADTLAALSWNRFDEMPDSLKDNPAIETQYDSIGRVEFTIDEVGNLTQNIYNEDCACAGRLKETRSFPDLADTTKYLSTHYEYYDNGNQRYVTDPKGNRTEFIYDDYNHLVQTNHPETLEHGATSTQIGYDNLGRQTLITDEEGKRTKYKYDALGRLKKVWQEDPSPENGTLIVTAIYQYDEAGNRTSEIDALGQKTSFEYDNMGRRTKRILPEGQEETYIYNDWGELEYRIDFNGHTTTYKYDAMSRLRREIPDVDAFPLEVEVVYTYDNLGRIDTMTDASGTTKYDYYARGNLKSKTNVVGTLAYTYYENNNLKSTVSDSMNGLSLAYEYDGLNRLDAVFDHGANQPPLEHDYDYDANGNLETLTYSNGVTHTWEYDARNRLKNLSISNQAFQILNAFSYELKASGHRSRITEIGGRVVDYAYDDQYRLTQETVAGDTNPLLNGASNWKYDLVGNRLSQESQISDLQSQIHTYSANNWLDRHTYDSNGNTKESQISNPQSEIVSLADHYDWRNRLIRREKSDGTIIQILYDGNGDRVRKKISNLQSEISNSYFYLVDRNNLTGYAQVVEEQSQGGQVEVIYAYGLDLISQDRRQEDGSFAQSYYLYDGLGSIRALADSIGTITDEYTYDAWGVLLNEIPNSLSLTPNSYRFTGEQWDEDLEMYFLRARYLNASTGRFHTMDTFEGRPQDPVTLHKYLYANANPVSYVDPSGYLSVGQQLAVVAIVGTLAKMAIPRVARAVISEEDFEALSSCMKSFINKYYTIDGFNVISFIDELSFYSAFGGGAAIAGDFFMPWIISESESYIRNARAFLENSGLDRKTLKKLPKGQRKKIVSQLRKNALSRLKVGKRVLGTVSSGLTFVSLTGQATSGFAYSAAAFSCLND